MPDMNKEELVARVLMGGVDLKLGHVSMTFFFLCPVCRDTRQAKLPPNLEWGENMLVGCHECHHAFTVLSVDLDRGA